MEIKVVSKQLINELKKYKNIVGAEIGVLFGATSKYLLDNCNIKNWFAIDPYKAYDNHHPVWDETKSQFFMNKMQSLARETLKKYPVEFLENIQQLEKINVKLDFVYIDGDHTNTLRDLCEIWYYMKEGSIISGHDWNDPHVGKLIQSDVKLFCKLIKHKKEVFIGTKDILGNWDNSIENTDNWWFYKEE